MVLKNKDVDLYLLVYYHIQQGLNPTQICKRYNWKKQRISHYIAKLKANELIEKVGYGVWKTTSKQVQKYHKDGTQYLYFSKVRGHGFQFKLILPKELRNWDRRVEYLKKNNISFDLIGNKCTIPRIIYKGCKVWLCNESIIIYYPKDVSFFSTTAKKSKSYAVHHFYSLIRQIERVLRGNFKIKGKYLFKIPKRHYSLIKNEFAGYYLKENKKLEIRDHKGELWALVDNSMNLEEFELIHPITAEKDTDKVIEPFMNILRANPHLVDNLQKENLELKMLTKELQQRVKEVAIESIHQTMVIEKILENKRF